MDLVIEDDSDVDAVYFTMSEDNVRKQIVLPWMSFGSDGASQAAGGVFLLSSTHPRAYGAFARKGRSGRYFDSKQALVEFILGAEVRRLAGSVAGFPSFR